MLSYEQRLKEFAQGKKLRRLRQPVRSRADAVCDACGSPQPRILYGLKDTGTGRCHFVGQNCLKELASSGAILRGFGRDSAEEAYEAEAQRRTGELRENGTAPGAHAGDTRNSRRANPQSREAPSRRTPDQDPLFPAVLIVETPDSYQAFVCIPSAHGAPYSWGQAREARYEEAWRRTGERGLVLEKMREARPDALGRCVTNAWREASLHLPRTGELSSLATGTDGPPLGLPGPLAALLALKNGADSDNHRGPPSGNRQGIVPAVARASA